MAEDRNFDQVDKLEKLYNEDEEYHADHVAGRGLGIRHVQAAVMAVAAFMGFALRINLSVAIVAMVRNKNDTNITATAAESVPTFDWDEGTQGYLLSSFFWGYMILQIPAGIITERYGGHRFLCFAIIGSSLLTLMTPQCAYIGDWLLVCINRMCQGICQGFLFPSMFTLLGLWSPPLERSRLASISLGAQLLGMVAATPISGYLVTIYGWPSVFYTFGGAGIALGVLMIFLGADSPANHKMISEEEKQYIQTSLGGPKVQLSVPWRNVLTSAPCWAALLAMSFYALVYIMLLTKIPTYLATVLKFSIDDNGVLSALPYLVAYILSFIFSGACDFVIHRGFLNLTAARKVFNSIAHFGSAICIILMAHVEDRVMSMFLLCAFMGCQAAAITGVQANFVDLAPNFSGPIFSVGNFTSAVLGLAGPIIVGFIVTEAGSASQWRIVFYLCALVLVLSNIVYIFLGSAETQWWNWPDRYTGKCDLKESDIKNGQLQERSLPRLSLT